MNQPGGRCDRDAPTNEIFLASPSSALLLLLQLVRAPISITNPINDSEAELGEESLNSAKGSTLTNLLTGNAD